MPDISHFQCWSVYWYQDLCARYLSLPALVYILVSGSLCQISLTSSIGLYIGIRIFVPDISHFQCWSIYWYQDLCARYLSLPVLVYILVSGSLCPISLTSSVGLYIGIRIFVPDISHFQCWSIYWYQDLCARYISLPALVYILVSGSLCQIYLTSSVGYILVSGSLCQISPTSSVGLYIGIRIFVPDISHFQRWSIYWYQDLCARYLLLPALVSILVSGSLCQISLTSSIGLYIGIRIFVPDIYHFQRWSIYWSVQVLCSFDGQMSYVLGHRVAGGENQACNGPLLFLIDCATSW